MRGSVWCAVLGDGAPAVPTGTPLAHAGRCPLGEVIVQPAGLRQPISCGALPSAARHAELPGGTDSSAGGTDSSAIGVPSGTRGANRSPRPRANSTSQGPPLSALNRRSGTPVPDQLSAVPSPARPAQNRLLSVPSCRCVFVVEPAPPLSAFCLWGQAGIGD